MESYEHHLTNMCTSLPYQTKNGIGNGYTLPKMKINRPFTNLDTSRVSLQVALPQQSSKKHLFINDEDFTINLSNSEFKTHADLQASDSVCCIPEAGKIEMPCPICLSIGDKDSCFTTSCGHKFCIDCFDKWSYEFHCDENVLCPMCRTPCKW